MQDNIVLETHRLTRLNQTTWSQWSKLKNLIRKVTTFRPSTLKNIGLTIYVFRLYTVKSRAVDQSTIQFCTITSKGHSTWTSKFPFINSLKILECANNRDCLLLATLQYLMYITLFPGRVILFITVIVYHVTKPEGNRAGYVSRSNFRKKNKHKYYIWGPNRPSRIFLLLFYRIFWNEIQVGTVFPHIVSAETILF